MKCWICGHKATSGEHHIKNSDLKRLFPNVSQKLPICHKKMGIKENLLEVPSQILLSLMLYFVKNVIIVKHKLVILPGENYQNSYLIIG